MRYAVLVLLALLAAWVSLGIGTFYAIRDLIRRKDVRIECSPDLVTHDPTMEPMPIQIPDPATDSKPKPEPSGAWPLM